MTEKTEFGTISKKDPLVIKLGAIGVPEDLLLEVENRLRDHLTGLPKAETCQAIANELIQSGRQIALEFDDLRFLKIFNETIGHEKTNVLLKEIANVYRNQEETLKTEGIEIVIGRYAGDSFLIIVPDKSKEEAEKILGRIHHALRQIKKPEGAPFKPHFSRGMAHSEELPPDERTCFRLIELADTRAKKEKEAKWDYMKKRARKKKNKPTRELVRKIRRYG